MTLLEEGHVEEINRRLQEAGPGTERNGSLKIGVSMVTTGALDKREAPASSGQNRKGKELK